MRFEFATAGRIVFGSGARKELPAISAGLGRKAFTLTGKRLKVEPPEVHFIVEKEPTIDCVRQGVERFRSSGCDHVVAIGGGSVIDAGKAIAAIAANPGDILDYLEVIGKGRPLDCAPYPIIAAPTTAGTGSEVTRNSVLGSPEHRVKVSLRSHSMLPKAAIIDPELTFSLPPGVTASTGLDALTQLIEPFVSNKANPLTDRFCLDGMPRVARSLRRAYEDGSDRAAREDMAYASLLGGLALANAGLGVVHGFAAPIGGMFDAPHGAICGALLAAGMRANSKALREKGPPEELERYSRIARILTGDPDATPEDGADWVEQLVATLDNPRLGAWGITKSHIPELAERAARANSMKANPIVLSEDELADVVRNAL